MHVISGLETILESSGQIFMPLEHNCSVFVILKVDRFGRADTPLLEKPWKGGAYCLFLIHRLIHVPFGKLY